MLDAGSILLLIQSFLAFHKRARLPEAPMPLEALGRLAPDPKQDPVWTPLYAGLLRFLRLSEKPPLFGRPLKETAELLLQEWRRAGGGICFMSSGSTGEPKPCPHSHEELMEEAAFLAGLFKNNSAFVSAAPAMHCYGFMFGLWLPALLGLPVRRVIPLPGPFFKALSPGSAGIGVPPLYSAKGGAGDLSGIKLASAGGPVPAERLAGLRSRGAELLEIFGSSESGVLGWRISPDEPYELAPYFERRGGALERAGGRVVEIMDELDWTGPRRFLPAGRKDQLAQVGGVNVCPALVERRLRALPGVKDCAARLMRPEEGARLKVFIVPESFEDRAALMRRLWECAARFPPEERPGAFTLGQSLPRNSMGKLCDWDL